MVSNKRIQQPVTVTNVSGIHCLECPECQHGFMHQCGIEVFTRNKEDAIRGTNVNIDQTGSVDVGELASRDDGNPSARRDGMRIKFWCEACRNKDDPHELVISQHKGREEIYWERSG